MGKGQYVFAINKNWFIKNKGYVNGAHSKAHSLTKHKQLLVFVTKSAQSVDNHSPITSDQLPAIIYTNNKSISTGNSD